MKKRLLSLLLAVIMIVGLLPVTAMAAGGNWEGSGTAEDPYQIDDAADLAKLAAEVDGGNTYEGECFIVTQDIDLSSVKPWEPIGEFEVNFNDRYFVHTENGANYPDSAFIRKAAFKGTFDGNGKTISNLTLSGTNRAKNGANVIVLDDGSGLFAYNAGVVKNIVFSNAAILPNRDTDWPYGFRGGICVGHNDGIISNVTADGVIKSTANTGATYVAGSGVGGIVGHNNTGALVDGCSFSGTIEYKSNDHVGKGGIVGYNAGTIINCFNSGAITATVKGGMAGGLVGRNVASGIIENCYNWGTVTMKGSEGGGLVADNFGTINNSYNGGRVIVISGGTSYSVGSTVGDHHKKTINAYAISGTHGDLHGSGSDLGTPSNAYINPKTFVTNDNDAKSDLGDTLNAWVDEQNSKNPGKYKNWIFEDNDPGPKFDNRITHTLKYDANEGIGDPEDQSQKTTADSAEFTISSVEPTRVGYTFLGWADTANAAAAAYVAGDRITVSGEKTLYAVWAEKYELDYDLYDGVIDTTVPYTEADSYTAGTPITTPTVSKEGFYFAGWYSDDDFEYEDRWPGDGMAQMPAADLTLYARWGQYATIQVQKVDDHDEAVEGAAFTLATNDGLKSYRAISDEQGLVTFENVSEGYYTLTETAAPEGYIKSEKTWNFSVDINGNVKGYSQLLPNGYDYSNDQPLEIVNEKIVPVTIEIPVTKAVAKGGNTDFSGSETFTFAVEALNSNAGENSFAVEDNTITVLDMDGGNTIIKITVMSDKYDDVTSEGFRITEVTGSTEGWTYSTESYLVVSTDTGWAYYLEGEEADTPVESIVFTNTYTKNLYTVTWMSQDGKNTLETDTGVEPGTKPSFGKSNPTKDATAQYTYNFAGWATSPDQESGVAVAELPAVDGDEVYYAAFSKTVNKYTVTWKNDGVETPLEIDENVPYGTTPTYNGTTPTKAADVQYTYTFDKWLDKEGKLEEGKVVSDVTLTATYTETVNTYTVTYTDGVDDAVIFENDVHTVAYGSATPAFRGTPERAGYKFKGWEPVVADIVTGNAVYTAKWQKDYSWILLLGANDVKVKGLNTDDHVAYVVGRGDNKFVPTGTVTRAEAATMFFRLLTDEYRAYYWDDNASYADVADTAWYNVAIATLEEAGVIKDTDFGGNFRPNEPITRAEMAVMAAQFCTLSSGFGNNTFADVPYYHWAAREIALVQYVGWIQGYNGCYRPEDTITRAECVTIINRMLERGAETENMLSRMVTFVDVAPTAWYYEAVQEAANSHTYTRTNWLMTNEQFYGELWLTIEKAPDWAALEQAWAAANK